MMSIRLIPEQTPTPQWPSDTKPHPNADCWTVALAEAEKAIGLSDPNPRVGCVLVGANGKLLAQGHTQAAGGPHAEVMALQAAKLAGQTVEGATAYVTLEPCSHFGKTPPCCDALIQAGVSRVVVAQIDPNPQVAGRGVERLRAAGIAVDILPSDHPAAARSSDLNVGFFWRMTNAVPWVRLKVAASLDGRTALPNGVSKWITSSEARIDGHNWRKRAGALLTGVGTVLGDDPRLDVRHIDIAHQPVRVVIDSRLDIPLNARILQKPGSVLIYTALDQAPTNKQRRIALKDMGVTIVDCPNPQGKVDLAALLRDLAQREINELHVEAGHKLNGSFLREDLVNELLIYIAPKLLGEGHGLASVGPFDKLEQAHEFTWLDFTKVGTDLRLRAYRSRQK